MTLRMMNISDVVKVNPRLPTDLAKEVSRDVDFVPMAQLSDQGFVVPNGARALGEVLKGYTYFANGDVIVAKITPCMENGKAAYVDNLPHGVAFGSTEFHVLRPGPDVDGRYLFYMIWNPIFRNTAEGNMTGSAGQKRVPAKFFDRFEIPLPPLSEQKRIADILDKADAIRRKRQEVARLANDFSPGLFQHMFTFVAGRLGGNGIEPANSLTGKKLVADGWKRTTLGSEITLQRGIDITKKDHRPGNVPVISSGGVNGYHDTAYAEGPGVLLGRKGSVGSVHFVTTPYWPHDTTLWVREFNKNDARFVYEFFRQFPISEYEASSANPSLNRNNLHPVDVWWPPLVLQKRFAAIVTQFTSATQPRMDEAGEGVANLFNSLVQRAFKGEL